jgi:hypothetical protein
MLRPRQIFNVKQALRGQRSRTSPRLTDLCMTNMTNEIERFDYLGVACSVGKHSSCWTRTSRSIELVSDLRGARQAAAS